jgi:hypothetical protein
MKQAIIATAFALLLLASGCSSSSYGIRVIDGLPKETYLTFSKGSMVSVGDVFVLYHIQQAPASGGGHGGHGGHGGAGSGPLNLKHEVGKVQVIRIADETHALVKILSGIAEDDVQAEKVE